MNPTPSQESNKLRECPFCGGEAKLTNSPLNGGGIWSWVNCVSERGICNVTPTTHHYLNSPKEAIAAWNTRPDADRVIELEKKVADLKEQLSEKENRLVNTNVQLSNDLVAAEDCLEKCIEALDICALMPSHPHIRQFDHELVASALTSAKSILSGSAEKELNEIDKLKENAKWSIVGAKLIEEELKLCESKLDVAIKALERLSRLGNGDMLGNSDGNRIAQEALAQVKGME